MVGGSPPSGSTCQPPPHTSRFLRTPWSCCRWMGSPYPRAQGTVGAGSRAEGSSCLGHKWGGRGPWTRVSRPSREARGSPLFTRQIWGTSCREKLLPADLSSQLWASGQSRGQRGGPAGPPLTHRMTGRGEEVAVSLLPCHRNRNSIFPPTALQGTSGFLESCKEKEEAPLPPQLFNPSKAPASADVGEWLWAPPGPEGAAQVKAVIYPGPPPWVPKLSVQPATPP